MSAKEVIEHLERCHRFVTPHAEHPKGYCYLSFEDAEWLGEALRIIRGAAETTARPDMYTPWPLHDVLAKLIEAADHLLGHHQCDTHGHEEYRAAVVAGREILKTVGPSTAVKTSRDETPREPPSIKYVEAHLYGQPHPHNDVIPDDEPFFTFRVEPSVVDCVYGDIGGFVTRRQFDWLAALFGTQTLASVKTGVPP